jgi:Xaa-Pro aminopeptidase
MYTRTLPLIAGPAPALPASVFADRRSRLLELIGDGVAVLPAAPELLKSRDTDVLYRQASDFFYLTGFPEPDAVAVVTPHDAKSRLTLFVRPRAPEQEAWTGPRVGVERAAEEFGADAVYPISELAAKLPDLLKPADRIHCPIGVGELIDGRISEAFLKARRGRQRSGIGPMCLVDLEVTTGEMRLIKEAHELERIRTAAEISAVGHVAAMERTRPGVGEWEVQAALESAFRSAGAAYPAFPSIVGSGPNGCVLHYVSNHALLAEGELLLVDAGAEWGMYSGDITRTYPVSGRFSAEQLELYAMVLEAEEAGIAAVQPGATIGSIHDVVVRILARGLMDLKILPQMDIEAAIEAGEYKKFYIHQTSHWLGMDVHDAGPYRRAGEPIPLAPGMVLTIEPGIYIPADAAHVPEHFRGVGIRIEDDVIVTADGPEVITRGVPVLPAEIEAIMGNGGF